MPAKGWLEKKWGSPEQHDNGKVEVEELELMKSSEDSEVNLRYILMNASKRVKKHFRDPQHERRKGALGCKPSAIGAVPETEGRVMKGPVKAPPNTRRRMMPPTPQQSSHSSTEGRQCQAEMETLEKFWSAREMMVIANRESCSDKIEFRESEHLVGLEDSEVI